MCGMAETRPSTHQKALQLNLDESKYGTFAEIGAGQEVAGWFFHVGHAAGTVAKTISAYDMAVSDAIYGRSDRYVSRARLESMLEYEFDLLRRRLNDTRGDTSRFFVFADTVATRNRSRQATGHGWLGMRFQTEPRSAPSEVIVHVNMLDNERVHEQEALGIIGVNLLHAAMYYHSEPAVLIDALVDDLSHDRIEVDMIKFSGPGFAGVDNRLMSLQLVEKAFTDAALFTADGEVVQPSEVLYKKPILVERGRFRPITNLTLDLLERAREQFLEEPQLHGEAPVVLLEMTLRDLASESGIDQRDFLARVDILRTLGQTVLISSYGRYFRLVEYLSRYTQKMIGIALGIPSIRDIADDKYYPDLQGGMLESVGRLFKQNVTLYVYPSLDPSSGNVVTIEQLEIEPRARHLLAYLIENHRLVPIRKYNPEYLPIISSEVLRGIQSGDVSWENLVPASIVGAIKRDRLFGWQPQATV
jgi:hypothetical protein